MSCYPESDNHTRSEIKCELSLSNFAKKADLKVATCTDTPSLATNASLTSLET